MVAVSLEKQSLLTQDFVHSVLAYDPETGVLTWKTTRHNRVKAGAVAGRVHKAHGHICIDLNGHEYQAHRVIWFMVTGEWPKGQVDHRDEVKTNNRWANLRDATNAQNQRNISCLQRNNKSGVRGVCWSNRVGKWWVQIGYGGRGYTVGYYNTIEEAAAARRAAEIKHFGEFAPSTAQANA
jgi:hypothetical protein